MVQYQNMACIDRLLVIRSSSGRKATDLLSALAAEAEAVQKSREWKSHLLRPSACHTHSRHHDDETGPVRLRESKLQSIKQPGAICAISYPPGIIFPLYSKTPSIAKVEPGNGISLARCEKNCATFAVDSFVDHRHPSPVKW